MATSQGVPTKIPVSRWQEVAKEGLQSRCPESCDVEEGDFLRIRYLATFNHN